MDMTNALNRIVRLVPTAQRPELSVFSEIFESICASAVLINANLSIPIDLELDIAMCAVRDALGKRTGEWRSAIAAANSDLAPDIQLRPTFSPGDIQSHFRMLQDNLIGLSRNHGYPLMLSIDGKLIGEVDPYKVNLERSNFQIRLSDGQMLSSIPVDLIQAGSSDSDDFALLVGTVLLQPGDEGYVKPYVIKIVADRESASSQPFILNPEGWYTLAPGRYAILGSPLNDFTTSHPDHPNGVHLTEQYVDGLAIVESEGVTFLVASLGPDRLGAKTRAIGIGDRAIVSRGYLAVARISKDTPSRQNPYSSKCDLFIPFDVGCNGVVSLDDDGLTIYSEGQITRIDPWRPGAFELDGVLIDMEEEGVAGAFDYGTDMFEGSLDEHGVFMDVKVAADRLQSHGAADLATALEATGQKHGILYYAPPPVTD